MIAKSQTEAIEQLRLLASSRRQSVLIVGAPGCGKSYLAKQYANMLNIDNFSQVAPKVVDIRDALDECMTLSTPVMLEIHNLDTGVAAASYTLLKSLEEPSPNVYIVLTCRSADMVPDTIISRSAVVTVSPPTDDDIDEYGKEHNLVKFNNVSPRLVWQCVRSFTDADKALNMSIDQVMYYESLSEVCKFKDSVSNIIWKLSHYESGEECDVELSIRSVMELMHNPFVTRCGIECIRDLNRGRIAKHAVIAKFAFNAKFCE